MSEQPGIVLTPEVKQVAQLLQNGNPKRRVGLYVRAKILQAFGRGDNNGMAKIAEDKGALTDVLTSGAALAALPLGTRLSRNVLASLGKGPFVARHPYLTAIMTGVSAATPSILAAGVGSVAAGELLDRKWVPESVGRPIYSEQIDGGRLGERVGLLAAAAKGLGAGMGMRGVPPMARVLAGLGGFGRASMYTTLAGKAVGQVGGYYVGKTNAENQAANQSEAVDTTNPYTGQ